MSEDIDIGKISEALNNKTDRDFNNMNPSSLSKQTIVGWGMPDYSAGISVTIPFTATSDGVLKINTNGYWYGYINGGDMRNGINLVSAGGGDQTGDFILSEGTIITLREGSGTNTLTFYPMKGTN